ncbi:MAG: hypothetical protein NVS3B11_04240 [Collimonas sp.]
MNKLAFTQKRRLPLLVNLVALFSISVFDACQARQIRLEERKSDLMNVSNAAISMVKEYVAMEGARGQTGSV